MKKKPFRIKKNVETRLPTEYGDFRIGLYLGPADKKEHLALVKGDVFGKENVLVRIHSECLTGDLLGSNRCDCGQQLHNAMRLIENAGEGVVIYLRQEGRGIGLLEKLRAYNLQDQGLDTVDANLALGHEADERDYEMAAAILNDLGVRSVRLITNNPAKISQLEEYRMRVADRVSSDAEIRPDNAGYLFTKAARMNHLLDIDLLQPVQKSDGYGIKYHRLD
jgi:GTP cyclohydrolase II